MKVVEYKLDKKETLTYQLQKYSWTQLGGDYCQEIPEGSWLIPSLL